MRLILLVLCTALLVGGLGFLEVEADQSAGTHEALTPQASLNIRSISDLQFSPDGARLAFVVTEPSRGTGRLRHIWVYERQSGVVRQYTHSAKAESSPRWSPDGKDLAFLSNREEDQQQIFVMRANGGEGAAVTQGEGGGKRLGRGPGGEENAFLCPDVQTGGEEEKGKGKNDAPGGGQ